MALPAAISVMMPGLTAATTRWQATLQESLAYLTALTQRLHEPQQAVGALSRLVGTSKLPLAMFSTQPGAAALMPCSLAAALAPLCAELTTTLAAQPPSAPTSPLVPTWQPLDADLVDGVGAWLWRLGPPSPHPHHRMLALFMPQQALLAKLPAVLRTVGLIASVTSITMFLCHREDGWRQAQKVAQQAQIRSETLSLELQQAVRTIDSFTTLAAHELRTPLSALMLQTDSIARLLTVVPLPTERIDHKVQAINRQVERLHRLVEDLLDVSRLEEGRLVVRQEQVDVGQIAHQVVARLAEPFARANTKLQHHIEPACVGLLDAARIDQVISNLMLNALKYGMGQPVKLSVYAQQATIWVVVVDQGIGIDPAAHEHIFSRYGRAVSERDYGGLGLGLWISRQVVRALGGEVQLVSQPAQGARFAVHLPMRPELAASTRRREHRRPR